jgi:hypothetical protein
MAIGELQIEEEVVLLRHPHHPLLNRKTLKKKQHQNEDLRLLQWLRFPVINLFLLKIKILILQLHPLLLLLESQQLVDFVGLRSQARQEQVVTLLLEYHYPITILQVD